MLVKSCYGAEIYSLKDLLSKEVNNVVLVVNNDDIEKVTKELNIFLEIDADFLSFPAWDIAIYDRVSPSSRVQQERIRTIHKLTSDNKRKIIVTSIEALALKTISHKEILSHTKKFLVGEKYQFSSLTSYLSLLGYSRTSTVFDHSEFAARGSIIDIFDNYNNCGVRLDFFGDTLESIKLFDLTTQKTFSSIKEFTLFQASEVILNEKSKEIFLTKYKLFNPNYPSCPLYEAVKEGNYFAGWENWLALFHEDLISIFDYFGKYSIYTPSNLNLKINNLYKNIESIYEERIRQNEKYKEEYFPLPPAELWLLEKDLIDLVNLVNNELRRNSNHIIYDNNHLINNSKLQIVTEEFKSLEKGFSKYKKIFFFTEYESAWEKISDYNPTRIEHFLDHISYHTKKGYYLIKSPIRSSFATEEYLFIGDDLLHKNKPRKTQKAIDLDKLWDELSQLKEGDYVVHKLHGIAIYQGIHNLIISGGSYDCAKLLFADNDILYLPAIGLELISKYKAEDGSIVKLDKLGANSWQMRRAKIKNRIKEIAIELLKIAAIRQTKEGRVFYPDSDLYQKFCDQFPYAETNDQLEAISAVLDDLASGRPMDRLICGDVGFGKTEVAIRAAFAVAQSKDRAQVAIIAPTTLLVRQHFHNLQKRFDDYDIKVAQISRFVTPTEVKRIKSALASGEIDIVVGTHSLLAKDLKFFDLGLVIIDEEQHFGVKQKEALKQIKTDCHVLTLSATPIPRTLQMSIVGIKELSLIATPPVDRMAIKTSVVHEDYHFIAEVISKEIKRGGSVFFVSPRIAFLTEIKNKLDKFMPGHKARIAHGSMEPKEIEDTMIDFFNKKFDILLSTSIIESGIDLPFVNTIIIHRSDMFGLAALYQLRGRVGRGKIKAYAYLLLPKIKINKTALQRLEVMQSLDRLGAGFSIASSDMDIRGFGNLLGEEQSGHIKEVGIELYQTMLIEAIEELKNNKELEEDYNPNINLGLPMLIPDNYIGDAQIKLSIYKKAGKIKEMHEIIEFQDELIDRFGKMPIEVKNFLVLIKFKVKCKKLMIEKLDVSDKAISISFRNNKCLNPEKMIEYISKNSGHMKIRSDQKFILSRQFSKIEDRLNYLEKILDDISF